MRALILRFVLAALSLLPFAAGATYVFNTVEFPGAVFTDVRGINNTGRIVGYASFDGVTFFSFTYHAGVFSPLPPLPGGPGTLEAVAHGMTAVPGARWYARWYQDHPERPALTESAAVTKQRWRHRRTGVTVE